MNLPIKKLTYKNRNGELYRLVTMATDFSTGLPIVVFKSIPQGIIYTVFLIVWDKEFTLED
jgi:hypothetical protein